MLAPYGNPFPFTAFSALTCFLNLTSITTQLTAAQHLRMCEILWWKTRTFGRADLYFHFHMCAYIHKSIRCKYVYNDKIARRTGVRDCVHSGRYIRWAGRAMRDELLYELCNKIKAHLLRAHLCLNDSIYYEIHALRITVSDKRDATTIPVK